VCPRRGDYRQIRKPTFLETRSFYVANHYLQFSEQIELHNKEEVAWAKRQLDAAVPDADREWERLDEDCNGFEWEIVEKPKKRSFLWFYAEESGNPPAVARFVQAFLRKFRPAERFTLTYACYCDRLRLGEFGGGAVAVTADSIEGFDVHDWVATQASRGE